MPPAFEPVNIHSTADQNGRLDIMMPEDLRRTAFVYILQHKVDPVVKIGRSSHPLSRARELPEDLDLQQSYVIAVAHEDAAKVEKMMHFLCRDLATGRPRGDGYTEWFDQAALAVVRGFLKRNALRLELQPLSAIAARRSEGRKSNAGSAATRRGPIADPGIGVTIDAIAVDVFLRQVAIGAFERTEHRVIAPNGDIQVYLRGETLHWQLIDELSNAAMACDTRTSHWLLNTTYANGEAVLRFDRTFLQNHPTRDLADWLVRIPLLPEVGLERERFNRFRHACLGRVGRSLHAIVDPKRRT